MFRLKRFHRAWFRFWESVTWYRNVCSGVDCWILVSHTVQRGRPFHMWVLGMIGSSIPELIIYTLQYKWRGCPESTREKENSCLLSQLEILWAQMCVNISLWLSSTRRLFLARLCWCGEQHISCRGRDINNRCDASDRKCQATHATVKHVLRIWILIISLINARGLLRLHHVVQFGGIENLVPHHPPSGGSPSRNACTGDLEETSGTNLRIEHLNWCAKTMDHSGWIPCKPCPSPSLDFCDKD